MNDVVAVDEQARANLLFLEQRRRIHTRTDRWFAGLLAFEFLVGIAAAIWISPRTWAGTISQTHIHIWAAVWLGGAIASLPVLLAWIRPGRALTRHVIAVAQMLTASLLIHLCGGRLEVHFLIFGSLAFLAFYRDWRVLASATVVVAADHFLRGYYWPQSVFGVLTASPWRWLEHAGWVIFENIFLIRSCIQSEREMQGIAQRQVSLEVSNENIEREVLRRTEELAATNSQLKNSEARSRAILETAADAIITIDANGAIQSFNPAAEKMFGYAADEIHGENVSLLMPAPFQNEHDGYLERYLTTGIKMVIGVGREVIAKRRDGTTLPIELSVSEIEQNDQPMFTGIVRDISERRRVEDELLEANAAAEAANQAKSEFLANMSHELRTPLNAIIGFSEGLLERTHKHPLNDHQKDRLTKIHQSGGHLLGLINDILDLAKVESGKREVHLTEFDPQSLADEVAMVAEGLLRNRENLDFNIRLAQPMPVVKSDRDMVKQILINLVSNAIKFTESGSISIHFLAETDRVIISVEDTGVGIPETDLPKVFNKFHQVDQDFRPSQAGTGLGLSICRSFAEMLGATLNVRSVQGEGSTFALSLPRGSAPPATKRSAQVVNEVRERCQSVSTHHEQLRVLCIEDNPDSMLVITDMLMESGFSVIPAFDGEEGLAMAREHLPDAITLDVMLPDLDGWEVLRRLKADPLVCGIPVIMATAIDETGFGLNLGAADYVVKPIRKQTLLGVMQRLSDGLAQQYLEIAIVDDDPNVRDIISEVLTEAGFNVTCYESGDLFLQALPAQRPDAVVLDLMMPGTDGFGVVEALKQDLELKNIPVVVMTAQALSSSELINLNRHVRTVIEKNGLSRKRALRDLLQQLKTIKLETVGSR